MLRLRILGDLRFELGDPRPEHEALLVADLANRGLDLGAQRRVLALQIEKWYLHGRGREPRCLTSRVQHVRANSVSRFATAAYCDREKRERATLPLLSAPGNRRRQTGLPMASIRLRARQRALKTNWWVALMFSWFAG